MFSKKKNQVLPVATKNTKVTPTVNADDHSTPTTKSPKSKSRLTMLSPRNPPGRTIEVQTKPTDKYTALMEMQEKIDKKPVVWIKASDQAIFEENTVTGDIYPVHSPLQCASAQ